MHTPCFFLDTTIGIAGLSFPIVPYEEQSRTDLFRLDLSPTLLIAGGKIGVPPAIPSLPWPQKG